MLAKARTTVKLARQYLRCVGEGFMTTAEMSRAGFGAGMKPKLGTVGNRGVFVPWVPCALPVDYAHEGSEEYHSLERGGGAG